MRRLTARALLIVLTAALMTAWSQLTPAYACSCASIPISESFEQADAVFVGRLDSRTVSHPGLPNAGSDDPALHVFAVQSVYKGEVRERQGVVSASSSATCGLELQGDGPFMVFASRDGDVTVRPAPGQYAANLCNGTAPATSELVARLKALGAKPETPRAEATAAAPTNPLPGAAATTSPWNRSGLVVGGALVLLVGWTLRRGLGAQRRSRRTGSD